MVMVMLLEPHTLSCLLGQARPSHISTLYSHSAVPMGKPRHRGKCLFKATRQDEPRPGFRIQDSGFRLRRWLLCRANVPTILPLDEARSEGDTGALGLLLPPEPLPPHGALGLPRGPSRPAGLRWLTGVLPKDCVAHELEKALGIEAGAVDRHRVLEESWGCPGAEGASTNSWRQPWTDAVCVRGAPSVSKGSRWLHGAVASWEGLTEQGTVAPSGEGDWVPGNGWKLFRQRPIRIFDFFNQL